MGQSTEKNINDRFKELRLACGKSQEEFGEILGLTKSGISNIETGKRKVTAQHLIALSNWKDKKVNIEWLKTGIGDDKFIQPQKADEVKAYVSDLLEDNGENPLYEIIIEIMHTYSELSPKSQEVLRDASAKLLENLAKRNETALSEEEQELIGLAKQYKDEKLGNISKFKPKSTE